MVAGDLTLTNVGTYQVTDAALKTAVDAINLPAATDFLYILPIGNGQVRVIKVVRA
jgi:hypothetical protein